ncbi:DNA polymerase epsilon subunit 3 [Liparis tanakae]|uniref:DNA polymerase epsilon subunit 3 n=1 Tax=Liparis tanakae TaxID=230148 RepID=A0A4Z2H153_9TELE|nr:DNA polymerase epsilon subunit 3 [Liparis tanakae]
MADRGSEIERERKAQHRRHLRQKIDPETTLRSNPNAGGETTVRFCLPRSVQNLTRTSTTVKLNELRANAAVSTSGNGGDGDNGFNGFNGFNGLFKPGREMAERPEDLNLPNAVITRIIKEANYLLKKFKESKRPVKSHVFQDSSFYGRAWINMKNYELQTSPVSSKEKDVGSSAANRTQQLSQPLVHQSLPPESVEGASLPLEGIHHIHGGHRLPLGVLGVGDGVTDHVLQEHLQHSAGLLVDQTGDTLHSTAAGQTADSGLGDSLDVITEDFTVYLELVYLVTALVPSDTACFASSPGSSRRTAVWISLDVMVERLL